MNHRRTAIVLVLVLEMLPTSGALQRRKRPWNPGGSGAGAALNNGRDQRFENEDDDDDKYDKGGYDNERLQKPKKKEDSTSAENRVLSNFLQRN